MIYDEIDYKKFKSRFNYDESGNQNVVSEKNSLITGGLLILFLVLIPMHLYLAFVNFPSVREIFGSMEIVLVLILLLYSRLEITLGSDSLSIKKKGIIFSTTKRIFYKDIENIKVEKSVINLFGFINNLQWIQLSCVVDGVRQPLVKSLTLSNGSCLFIIEDVLQQNIRKGKFVAEPQARKLPFSVASEFNYYAVNFFLFWSAIFLFVLGFAFMQYFVKQDVDFIAWIFSMNSLLVYTSSVFVLSMISGYLIKNH